jgi:tetratricopeptide (TPR) repeat protein
MRPWPIKTASGISTAVSVAFFFATAVPSRCQNSDQTLKNWDQCIGSDGQIIPDAIIDGCSAIIQFGQANPRLLATAFNNRGFAYKLKGDYDRALQDYDQAIRLNPNNANAYNNRGMIYKIRGEYDRAIEEYSQAIWLSNNDYPAAFFNRAKSYFAKGQYDRALADFDIVLRFNPRNPNGLYGRGLAEVRSGDTTGGMADIAAAKAINPNIAEEYEQSGPATKN